MTASRNQRLGAYGERVAARHLAEAGMTVVDRNWRCELGELDLVLREGDLLVCCEVKTRSGEVGGHPLEAVAPPKAERLRLLALRWAEDHGLRDAEVRIDLVGVLATGRGAATVQHVRGVA